MSFKYLSEDQRARYRRFLADPSPEDLERFFYLDAVALAEVAKKRGPHNRIGWAVQWGTVRMLGTFLADPGDVPHVAVEYVAEQVGVADPSCIKNYPERLPTQHEHAREIRGLLGYREFAEAEAEVRTFVASRATQTRDSRRELFDRAVLWLIGGRVLLPGITTLAPLVTSVRAEQLAAINDHLAEQTPLAMRRERLYTLVVPEGKKVSPLEWMRTAVAKVSGTGMKEALDRSSAVWAFGAGAVDAGGVAPVKLTELAAYGMHAKAPKIEQLKGTRRVATLLATMRHLEGVSVDDALLLFELLMTTKLLARAGRGGAGCAGDDGAGDDRADRVGGADRAAGGRARGDQGVPSGGGGRRGSGVAGGADEQVRLGARVRGAAGRDDSLGRHGRRVPGDRGVAGLAPGPGVRQARGDPAHRGAQGPGVGFVAAAGVRQPRPRRRADRPACLHILRAGGLVVGVAQQGRVRRRRGQVRRPEGQAHPGRPVERALGQHPDRPRPGRRPRHAPAQARGRPGRGVPGTRRQPGRQPGHHDQGRPAEPGEAGGGPAAGGLPGRGRRGDEEAAANRLPRTAAGGPRPHRHVRRVRPHLRVDVPPGGPGHQPRRPDGGPLPI